MATSSAADTAETWTHARSALALAIQKYGKNSPEAAQARANFTARRLATTSRRPSPKRRR